jgi:hypothetical protein
MHSIVRGTGTPKDRASYILFEYIDPAEVGADSSLAEVELRKPRNLFVCVSEEREDEERGEKIAAQFRFLKKKKKNERT